MNIQLTEEWERFIQEEVHSGRYASEAAVLGEALALLRQRERGRKAEGSTTPLEARSIGEIIDDVMGDLPAEDLQHLPEDGAAQHDHYIYGIPKRPS